MKQFLALALGVFFTSTAFSKVITKDIEYKIADQVFKGFVASPEISGTDKKPAVLVVHEWWGHNDYAKKRAKMLAEVGYVAMALDMYGNGTVANHPSQAGEMSSALKKDPKQVEARFDAALKELLAQPGVDPEKVAAIGYCFGGGIVLDMARKGKKLSVVASFHGPLSTELKIGKGKVTTKMMVFNGEADPFIKKEEIAAFEAEMKKAEVSYELIQYPGALHSFTNPNAKKLGKDFNLPLAYDQSADRDSWSKTLAAFAKAFQ